MIALIILSAFLLLYFTSYLISIIQVDQPHFKIEYIAVDAMRKRVMEFKNIDSIIAFIQTIKPKYDADISYAVVIGKSLFVADSWIKLVDVFQAQLLITDARLITIREYNDDDNESELIENLRKIISD